MKRPLRALLAFSLAAAAASAAAQAQPPQAPAPQAPAPQAPATPPAPAPERRPLILDLDEASRRQILSGTRANETGRAGDKLPSLGEGARPLEQLRSSPYPKSDPNIP